MNLADALRGLRRRWYIVLPGLLVAATLSFAAWQTIPPGYERSATQLLIPGADSMPEGANPYLFLGGLSPAADVLVRAIGAKNVLNEVMAEHPGVQIDISRDTTTAGPIILIVVTADSDTAAAEVLGLIVQRTGSVLEALQQKENIAVKNLVTVLPISVDSHSNLRQRSRLIATGSAGLVTVAFTVFVAGMVDGFSVRRRGRRAKPGSKKRNGTDPSHEVVLDSSGMAGSASMESTLSGAVNPSSYDGESDLAASFRRSAQ